MSMPNVDLNGQSVLITLAVILIVLEAISAISKGIDAWKKLTGKDSRTAEVQKINDRLDALEDWQGKTEARLEQGNKRFDEGSKDTTEILIALRSIIKHLQSGNDHDKLQETDDKLYNYLVTKRGVNPETLK